MKKNEEVWLHTQNHRQFPGFAVVVVTFFDEILYDFHVFFCGMCLVLEENQQPILGSHLFSRGK